MLKFTYITAVLIGISIICLLLPKKVYKRSKVDFRILGAWILIITWSIQCLACSFYCFITLVHSLLTLYGISWGLAI